jgi:hypothetical protein
LQNQIKGFIFASTNKDNKFHNQKHKDMNTMINALAAQAQELMKSEIVRDMLNGCATEEEKRMKLAIAAMYAMAKANA